MASSDIFVLTSKKESATKFVSQFPRAKIIEADTLTEDVLTLMLKRSLTKHFYIVRPTVQPLNGFDFTFTPDEWSTDYVIMWQDSSDIQLMTRKTVKSDVAKFTEAALLLGITPVKMMEGVVFTQHLIKWPWYNTIEEGYANCEEEFFFTKSSNVCLDKDFEHTYIPLLSQRQNRHVWQRLNPITGNVYDYSGVYLYPTNYPEPKTTHVKSPGCIDIKATVIKVSDINDNTLIANELSKLSNNELVYFTNSRLDIDWNFDYYPPEYDRGYVHVWKTSAGETSIKLISNTIDVDLTKFKILPTTLGKLVKYDVIYLSYNEPFAEERYKDLLKIIPQAKRVHGVKGIFNAHKRAAEIASTDMFYVVDADAKMKDDFLFDYVPDAYNLKSVHVWRCENPVNGLVYGYGGVKLFPTQALRDATTWNIDFTTSVTNQFCAMHDISNVTAFNTDPYNAWKSAFRECVKLSSKSIDGGVDSETAERLETWCTVSTGAEFSSYSLAGAVQGRAYGLKHKHDNESISNINDFEWLQQRYNSWITR